MNPKDIKWKSEKYRQFIREMMCMFCGSPLLNEKPDYEPHHHSHSGGKNPSDHLLINMCLRCHNEFHANEALFNERKNMRKEDWWRHCLGNLIEYAESLNLNSTWICIKALQEAVVNEEFMK